MHVGDFAMRFFISFGTSSSVKRVQKFRDIVSFLLCYFYYYYRFITSIGKYFHSMLVVLFLYLKPVNTYPYRLLRNYLVISAGVITRSEMYVKLN